MVASAMDRRRVIAKIGSWSQQTELRWRVARRNGMVSSRSIMWWRVIEFDPDALKMQMRKTGGSPVWLVSHM